MKYIHYIGLLGFCLPSFLLAQNTGFSASPGSEIKGAPTGNSSGWIEPFKYIGNAEKAPEENAPKRAPALQKIVDLNAAGDYHAAGTEGLALMATQSVDEELQLIIANSLAWTGRVKQAVPAYQGLSKGKFANAANVGMANINSWRGRHDLALPLYQTVLANDPTNADALEGFDLASRELSPRTTWGVMGSSDSSELKRTMATLNHRWRDDSGANIFEVEIAGMKDWLPTAMANQQEVTLRYQSLDLALKPSLELNMPTKLNRSLYATGRVKFFDEQLTVGAGRVNWGKMSVNPIASINDLSAIYLGANATQSFALGSVQGRIDYYGVSDGNSIISHSLNFNSAWRPLGSNFKPFAGIEGRSASASAKTYWSPVNGSGTAYAGILAEWGAAEWNLFGSAQLGLPLYGDAGNSWSVSAGGKHWLTSDIALNVNLWSMASWRENSAYRAQSANVSLEKLWR
jgi:tetratricopeptide (TPR) repeat protein